jgi:hypothetical protein
MAYFYIDSVYGFADSGYNPRFFQNPDMHPCGRSGQMEFLGKFQNTVRFMKKKPYHIDPYRNGQGPGYQAKPFFVICVQFQ